MPSPSERPTLEIVTDGATRTTTRPAERTEAVGALPTVLVCTADPGALQRLSLRLFGRATVHVVREVRTLKRQARVSERCAVVLDCAAPEIDPLDAASALRAVGTPPVVVWGAAPATKAELSAFADSARWVHVGIDTTPEELAELISSFC